MELGVELNMFEEEKYKVIKAVCNGQMTKERAELKLDLSRRQINRLVKNTVKKGKRHFYTETRTESQQPPSRLQSETKS